MSRNGRVVVAMSGGVDSSVAAALLRDAGWECTGVLMRNGIEPVAGGNERTCCSTSDAEDARRVADRLGIRFYALDFSREFDGIINYFVAEYNRGRTPNPCVMCNQHLKFGKLFGYADAIDAEFVATGHYARMADGVPHLDPKGQVREDSHTLPSGLRPAGTTCGAPALVGKPPVAHGEPDAGRTPPVTPSPGHPALETPALLRGVDRSKDQSYALFGVRRDLLRRMLLPVGGYLKPAIRELARGLGLITADKPDSQEICFVPDNDYVGIIRERTPDALRPGDVLDRQGAVVGRHEGHQTVTIGQRKGLRIALGRPAYVSAIDPATNTVVLGDKDDLLSRACRVERVNWLVDPPTEPISATIQIRYNHDGTPGTLRPVDGGAVEVTFDPPAAAVTPGQAAVFYDGERVLGGGWIGATEPA